MRELLSYSQKNAIPFFHLGGRWMTEDMLAKGVRKIAEVTDTNAELDLEQVECNITRKRNVSSDLRVCEQAFAMQFEIQ